MVSYTHIFSLHFVVLLPSKVNEKGNKSSFLTHFPCALSIPRRYFVSVSLFLSGISFQETFMFRACHGTSVQKQVLPLSSLTFSSHTPYLYPPCCPSSPDRAQLRLTTKGGDDERGICNHVSSFNLSDPSLFCHPFLGSL